MTNIILFNYQRDYGTLKKVKSGKIHNQLSFSRYIWKSKKEELPLLCLFEKGEITKHEGSDEYVGILFVLPCRNPNRREY